MYPCDRDMLDAIVIELSDFGEPFRVYPKDLIIEVITDRPGRELLDFLEARRLNINKFGYFETTYCCKDV